MRSSAAAFVAPTFVTRSFVGVPVSTISLRQVTQPLPRKRQPSRIACAVSASKDTAKSGKKKASPPPVFATDIKGNFVWTLRGATSDDVSAVTALMGEKFPSSMVESFIEDSTCCMVCEASVKGTKEGEGYQGKVMGAVLVDVSVEVKNKAEGFESGLVKKGEVIAIIADPALPNSTEIRKKILLGTMKKLKSQGAVEVSTTVASSDDDKIGLLKDCLFKATGTGGSHVAMKCNLVAENPDPQKKVL